VICESLLPIFFFHGKKPLDVELDDISEFVLLDQKESELFKPI
jgi:hypothetical protein